MFLELNPYLAGEVKLLNLSDYDPNILNKVTNSICGIVNDTVNVCAMMKLFQNRHNY